MIVCLIIYAMYISTLLILFNNLTVYCEKKVDSGHCFRTATRSENTKYSRHLQGPFFLTVQLIVRLYSVSEMFVSAKREKYCSSPASACRIYTNFA